MAASNAKKKPAAEEAAEPVHKIRVGAVSCAIWENENDGKTSYATTFQKSYKDDADEWHNTDSYYPSDLLNLAKAADMAHTWMLHAYAKLDKSKSKPSKPNTSSNDMHDEIPF